MNRTQACQRLKCSQTQCLRFEEKGLLHARREVPLPGFTMARVYYKSAEVCALAKWWRPVHGRQSKQSSADAIIRTNERGKYAARAFVMFGEAKSLRDIVIALEVDPLLVRQLYEEWKVSLGAEPDEAKRQRREMGVLAAEQRDHRHVMALEHRAHRTELARIAANAAVEAAREAAKITAAADAWKAEAEKRRMG